MNNLINKLPWHQSQWSFVNQVIEQKRLPHAILLTGPEGVGKLMFAKQLAQWVLSDFGLDQSAIDLLSANTHPDFFEVTLEVNPRDGKQAKALKVDQIRMLTEQLSLTSARGGYKVAIIHPADRMNQSAANSLLKTLEEPSRDTLLILIADSVARLMPTLRSRCSILSFNLPEELEAKQWIKSNFSTVDENALLAAACGAPLKALDIAKNDWLELRHALYSALFQVGSGNAKPVEHAYKLNALLVKLAHGAPEQLLRWWVLFLADLIKCKQSVSSEVSNQDFKSEIEQLSKSISLERLYHFYDDLLNAQTALYQPINLQQLLEKLFLEYAQSIEAVT